METTSFHINVAQESIGADFRDKRLARRFLRIIQVCNANPTALEFVAEGNVTEGR